MAFNANRFCFTAMKYFEVVALDDTFVTCLLILGENRLKVRINRNKLPVDIVIEVGDRFYHIEHQYYDIYGVDNKMKYGLHRLLPGEWERIEERNSL